MAMADVTGRAQVIDAVTSLPLGLWPVLISLTLLNFTARFTRWQLLLRWLQIDLPVRLNAVIYLSGFALTMTPGKVGETIRSLLLKRFNVSYSQSIGCFFSERMLDVVVVSTVAILVVTAFPQYQYWAFTAFAVILTIALLARSRLLGWMLLRLPVRKLGESAANLHAVIRSLLSGSRLLIPVTLGMIAWAAQGIALAAIVHAMGSDINPALLLGIYCLSILAGAASFIPGGIGTTESAMALLLSLAGMEPPAAVAAAITSHCNALACGIYRICLVAGS